MDNYIRQQNGYYRQHDYLPASQQAPVSVYDTGVYHQVHAAYAVATSDYQTKWAKVEQEKKKLNSVFDDRNAYINKQYQDPAKFDAKKQKRDNEAKIAAERKKRESDEALKKYSNVFLWYR